MYKYICIEKLVQGGLYRPPAYLGFTVRRDLAATERGTREEQMCRGVYRYSLRRYLI